MPVTPETVALHQLQVVKERREITIRDIDRQLLLGIRHYSAIHTDDIDYVATVYERAGWKVEKRGYNALVFRIP